MLTRMLQRRGTAAEWTDVQNTAILQPGEIGLETDTGKFKVGDGTTVWISLPYYLPDSNPTSDPDRIGKNNADIYSKLRATQTFKGSQILTPEADSATQIPLTVSAGAATSQSAILQRWRTNADGTLATLNASGYFESKGAKFTEAVDMSGKAITNVKNIDSNSTDSYAVNKKYVDEAIAGLAWKTPVNLVSLATGIDLEDWIDVPLTGNTGTVELDGHSALTQAHGNNYRLLLLNQTTPENDGIWVYSDNGITYTLTRATDSDSFAELKGASVFVQEGDLYGTSSFVQTNHYLSDFANQDWVQFNGASQINADGGLTKVGNTLAVGAGAGIQVNAESIQIANGGVVAGMLAEDSVTDEKIADNAVAQANMKDDSVGTAEIINSSVTTDKINAGAVTNAKIATDAIAQANMQNDSVGTDELINDSVTHAKVADDAIKNINVASDAAIAISKINGLQSALDAKVDDSHVYNLDDLGDVVITSPQPRQVIKYDELTEKFINEVPSGGISVGSTPPLDAATGDAWFDSTDGSLYVRYNDGIGTLIFADNGDTAPSVFHGNGYSTQLAITWTKDDPNSRYIISYNYYLSSTTSYFTGFELSGFVSINGATVWTPSGNYSVPSGGTVQISAGISYLAYTSSTDLTLTVQASLQTVNQSIGFKLPQATISITPVLLIDADTADSSQWVQVKANSALEASILTRMSAVEARSTKIEAANAVRVADEAERNSVYPAPVQGNTVFRADLGYEEKYYAAYDLVTNPDGTTGTIGWYEYRGGAPLSENKFINAGMDIWQRATTSVITSWSYNSVDRFFVGVNNGSGSVYKETTDVPSSQFAASLKIVVGGAGYPSIGQTIEQLNAKSFAGKTVTVSAYVKSNQSTAISMGLGYSTTGDTAYNGSWTIISSDIKMLSSDTWIRVSQTYDVPATATSLRFGISTDSSMSSGGTLYYTGFQIEEGPVATQFRRNQENIQAELAACQRYFERINGGFATNVITGQYVAGNGTSQTIALKTKQTMRVAPTPSISNLEFERSGVGSTAVSSVAAGTYTSVDSPNVTFTMASALTAGAFYNIRFSNTGYIDFNSEL